MATVAETRTPWHLWAVGLASLLWNCIGVYDYTMTQLRGAAYMTSMGMDAESAAYILALPAWATAGWALGVWGAIVGSVLLLVRSLYAVWAFVVSLLGVLVMTAYNLTTDAPAMMDSPANSAIEWAVKIIAALLLWYAWAMRKRGVLR